MITTYASSERIRGLWYSQKAKKIQSSKRKKKYKDEMWGAFLVCQRQHYYFIGIGG